MTASAPIVGALLGVIILFFGRRLFWLFVAAIGFALGVELAPHIWSQPTPLLALTFALVVGFIGALLALFLQKVAIAIAGFLAGGKLAVAIAATAFAVAQDGASYSLIFIIGGVLGTVLLLLLFDWALIFLSSVVGAHLVQGAFVLHGQGNVILFVVLVVVGILFQAGALGRRRVETAA